MVEYENECVGCPAELGCIGSSCPYINVKHLICDYCKEEQEELYVYGDDELCAECLLKQFEKITL